MPLEETDRLVYTSHRFGYEISQLRCPTLLDEIVASIEELTDDEIIEEFRKKQNKSISVALNNLIKQRLSERGWLPEAAIFQDEDYIEGREKVWRLDFAKRIPDSESSVSVEVSFNHGEAIAWNLTKPVLASEMNHVRKAIQTELGVIILATEEMKRAGGFDGAVGSYERACRYLIPMRDMLSVPLILIGIKAPRGFIIDHVKEGTKMIGQVLRTSDT